MNKKIVTLGLLAASLATMSGGVFANEGSSPSEKFAQIMRRVKTKCDSAQRALNRATSVSTKRAGDRYEEKAAACSASALQVVEFLTSPNRFVPSPDGVETPIGAPPIKTTPTPKSAPTYAAPTNPGEVMTDE